MIDHGHSAMIIMMIISDLPQAESGASESRVSAATSSSCDCHIISGDLDRAAVSRCSLSRACDTPDSDSGGPSSHVTCLETDSAAPDSGPESRSEALSTSSQGRDRRGPRAGG